MGADTPIPETEADGLHHRGAPGDTDFIFCKGIILSSL